MDEGLAYGFLIAIPVLFGIGIVYGIYSLMNPPPPPTPEQVWMMEQNERCRAMKGRLNVEITTGTAECFRTVFYRREPKLLFKTTYVAKP